MKKLNFLKNLFSDKNDWDKVANDWIIKNKNKLTSYRFITVYSELGDGSSIGDNVALTYTTKNNKPIPSSKRN